MHIICIEILRSLRAQLGSSKREQNLPNDLLCSGVDRENTNRINGWGTRIRSSQPRNLRNTTTFDPATALVGALRERVKTSKSVAAILVASGEAAVEALATFLK